MRHRGSRMHPQRRRLCGVRKNRQRMGGLFLSHLGAYRGLGGRSGNRTRQDNRSPARFATVSKSSNNTAGQYERRFATSPKIIECFLVNWETPLPPFSSDGHTPAFYSPQSPSPASKNPPTPASPGEPPGLISQSIAANPARLWPA
jgi:hypothetical protein